VHVKGIVTIECEDAGITQQAGALDCIKYQIRCELFIRVCHKLGFAIAASEAMGAECTCRRPIAP